MAARKAQQGRAAVAREAHNPEVGGSNPPPATPDTCDTERPPAPELANGDAASLTFVKALTEHMVAHGVRRVNIEGVEIELDPAAQFISREPVAETERREKPVGECRVESCRNKGGHLRTDYCRDHFNTQLRNPRSTTR